MLRYLGFILFASVALGIVAGLHYYFYLRLIRDVGLPREWRIGLTVVLIVAGLSIPAAMIIGRTVAAPWGAALVWPAFVWMGAMFLLFVMLVIGDTSRAVATHASRCLTPDAFADPVRRLFVARLLGGVAVLGAFGLSGLALASALTPPQVQQVRVALKRLPQELAGFVIVQLTDLHVGETVSRAFIEEVVKRTNALEPDLVVITGDLVDGQVDSLANDVAPLKDLRARYGVYFVTGNHEYYSGVDEWLRHLTGMGIRVLNNERITIGSGAASFDLAGVNDSTGGREMPQSGHGADVAKAMAGADPQREVVLLAHQPKEVEAACAHGVGLVLSGHTHGGQIAPFGLLVRLTQPYLQGLHLHKEKTWIYVSPGTGYWGPPMRLLAPAEITRIELQPSGDSKVGHLYK